MTEVAWLTLATHLIFGATFLTWVAFAAASYREMRFTEAAARETEQARDDAEAFEWDRERRRIQAERDRRRGETP